MSLHRWKLYAPVDNFEASMWISEIVDATEPEPIDHLFENGLSVFCGRGEPPIDPHIEAVACMHCENPEGCWWCCETGLVLMWVANPSHLIAEAVQGLRLIIRELEEPSLV